MKSLQTVTITFDEIQYKILIHSVIAYKQLVEEEIRDKGALGHKMVKEHLDHTLDLLKLIKDADFSPVTVDGHKRTTN